MNQSQLKNVFPGVTLVAPPYFLENTPERRFKYLPTGGGPRSKSGLRETNFNVGTLIEGHGIDKSNLPFRQRDDQ